MTNDPSMAITSTAPASEGADSTSKEGSTLPLPVTEGGNATPAPDAPPPDMVQRIGGTIYEVSFHFSNTSQETMSDIAIASVRYNKGWKVVSNAIKGRLIPDDDQHTLALSLLSTKSELDVCHITLLDMSDAADFFAHHSGDYAVSDFYGSSWGY